MLTVYAPATPCQKGVCREGLSAGKTIFACAYPRRLDLAVGRIRVFLEKRSGGIDVQWRTSPRSFPTTGCPRRSSSRSGSRSSPGTRSSWACRSSRPTSSRQWVFAAGELNAAVGQEGVERYVAMTCQTDDPEREAAYLEFIRDIEPKLKPLQNEVRNRYLDSPFRSALPDDRYAVFNRRSRTAAPSIARPTSPARRNWPSSSSSTRRSIGAMTVTFQGQERTLAQMAPFLEETDRSVRQEAWELCRRAAAPGQRRARRPVRPDDGAADRDRPEAGFDNFVDFAFRQRERFDYGIDDALRFHAAVEQVVVPLARKIQEEHRAGARRAEPLRPWDMAVDPLGRPPLEAVRRRREAGRGDRDDLPRGRSRARRPVRVHAFARRCSTWPTARGRPPAATRRRSRTTGCRSSS